jgi:RimJ/RimL family protein N-acetyltransferase
MKLRRLEKVDLPTRVDWANNPSIFPFMSFTPPISLENTIVWWENNQKNNSRFDAVFETDDGEYAAFGGLTGIDPIVRKAEFYIFANPDLHGRGIGTEATRMLCQYGFEVLQLHKIFLFANESNRVARRVYEKVGFTLEGVHRDEKLVGETFEGRCYYGLLACEYQKTELNMSGFNGIRVNDIP